MVLSVLHNSMESAAMSSIRKNATGLERTLERLATGKRINSPKDDPAGFIACQLIRSNVAKIRADVKANQMKSSRLATVESGMSQITSLLNQAKGIVLAAANTGALTQNQLDAYQMDLDYTITAIQRISKMTRFQGESVLSGLESLLNGTLTEEQGKEQLGIPSKNTKTLLPMTQQLSVSTSKTVAAKDGMTVADLAGMLAKTIKSVDQINKLAVSTDPKAGDLSISEEELTLKELTQQMVNDSVNVYLNNEFGADEQPTFQKQIAKSLVERTLNLLDGNDSINEIDAVSHGTLKEAISMSLASVVKEIKGTDSEPVKISLNDFANKLDELEQIEKEHAELDRVQKEEAEKKRIAEEKEKTEAEAKKLREEEQEARNQEAAKRADEMYWAKAKATTNAKEEKVVNEKSVREKTMEQIQANLEQRTCLQKSDTTPGMISGLNKNGNPTLLGLNDLRKPRIPQLAESNKESGKKEKTSKSVREQSQSTFLSILEKQKEQIANRGNKDNASEKDENANTKSAEITISAQQTDAETLKSDDAPVLVLDIPVTGSQVSEADIWSGNQDGVSEIDLTCTNACPEIESVESKPEKPSKPEAKSLDDLRSGGIADVRANPEVASKFLDEMLKSVSFARAFNGVQQRIIDVDNAINSDTLYQLEELDSQISDADFAEESSNLARYQILLQASMNVLKIAQDFPKMLLNLIIS